MHNVGKWLLESTGVVAVAALMALSAGCNNCEKLTEKICSDLGADDCAVWKEIDGPAKVVPQGRKPNRACGNILETELAYDGLLNGAKGTVVGEKLKRAVKAGDKAEIERLKGESEAVMKSVEEGLEKLKKQTGR